MAERIRKFRGKSLDDGHWVIGTSVSFYEGGSKALIGMDIDKGDGTFRFSWEKVRPETVGESIPKPDYEWLGSEELFEDDIVNADIYIYNEGMEEDRKETYVGVVTYVDGGYEIVKHGKKDGYPLWCRFQEDDYKILGNKWDNPELLEKEEPC